MNSAGCYRLKKISKVAKLERLGSEASKDIIPKRHKMLQMFVWWGAQTVTNISHYIFVIFQQISLKLGIFSDFKGFSQRCRGIFAN